MRTRRRPAGPSMIQVFINDLPRNIARLKAAINAFVNWFFSTSATSGARRQWFFTFFLGWVWARAAFEAHPIQLTDNLIRDLLIYPFPALFAMDIMRHVVIVVMVFLLGLRLTAMYLDDVFELNDILLAEKYILQAVFASQYSSITIKDGKVASEHLNSPVYRVGGPGHVKVHLDNVALFEKMDGSADPVGPQDTQKARKIDRFERLRAVVDLHEHNVSVTVRARTKDGIFVTADGAQILYSVARSKRREASLKNPMTYDPEAIEKIVYGEAVFKHFKSKADKSPPPPRPSGSAIDLNMATFIQSQLSAFISERFLSEFLTQTLEPEKEKQEQQAETLRQTAEELAATPATPTSVSDSAATMPSRASRPVQFISRDRITQQLYEEVNAKAIERGMQLHWVDIGTWVLPPEAEKIGKSHLEAWELSLRNQKRGTPMALAMVARGSQNLELQRLFREIPLNTYFEFQRLRQEDPAELVRRMLHAYRDRIQQVYSLYKDRAETPPEEIDLVARYLNYNASAHHVHDIHKEPGTVDEG